MDGSTYSCLYSITNMVILTQIGGFVSRDLQHKLSKKASPSLPDSDQANARLFVKQNQAARYECTIGCPGWAMIRYPVNEIFNTNTKFLLSSPYFKVHPCRASESVPPGHEPPKVSAQLI